MAIRSVWKWKAHLISVRKIRLRTDKQGSSEPPRDDCGTSQKPSWLAKPAANVRGGRDEKRLTIRRRSLPVENLMTKMKCEEVHRDAGDLRTKISIQPVNLSYGCEGFWPEPTKKETGDGTLTPSWNTVRTKLRDLIGKWKSLPFRRRISGLIER